MKKLSIWPTTAKDRGEVYAQVDGAEGDRSQDLCVPHDLQHTNDVFCVLNLPHHNSLAMVSDTKQSPFSHRHHVNHRVFDQLVRNKAGLVLQ